MKAVQSNFKFGSGNLYECVNTACFYNEILLGFNEVSWKDVWSTDYQCLVPVPVCPSCRDEVIFWSENEKETLLV